MNRLIVVAALLLASVSANATGPVGKVVLTVGEYEGATTVMFAAGRTSGWGVYAGWRADGEDEVHLCNDGWVSSSTNRSGTCSWHGGVARWNIDRGSAALGGTYTFLLNNSGTSLRTQLGLAAVRQGGAEVGYEYRAELAGGLAIEQMVGERFGLTLGYDTLLGTNGGVVFRF